MFTWLLQTSPCEKQSQRGGEGWREGEERSILKASRPITQMEKPRSRKGAGGLRGCHKSTAHDPIEITSWGYLLMPRGQQTMRISRKIRFLDQARLQAVSQRAVESPRGRNPRQQDTKRQQGPESHTEAGSHLGSACVSVT